MARDMYGANIYELNEVPEQGAGYPVEANEEEEHGVCEGGCWRRTKEGCCSMQGLGMWYTLACLFVGFFALSRPWSSQVAEIRKADHNGTSTSLSGCNTALFTRFTTERYRCNLESSPCLQVNTNYSFPACTYAGINQGTVTRTWRDDCDSNSTTCDARTDLYRTLMGVLLTAFILLCIRLVMYLRHCYSAYTALRAKGYDFWHHALVGTAAVLVLVAVILAPVSMPKAYDQDNACDRGYGPLATVLDVGPCKSFLGVETRSVSVTAPSDPTLSSVEIKFTWQSEAYWWSIAMFIGVLSLFRWVGCVACWGVCCACCCNN